MNFIEPKPLKTGDTIEIIAPGGFVDKNQITAAKNFLENYGYNVKLGQHLFSVDRYFAGTDEERLEDFHNAFLSKNTDAIICARGGYGAIRLINNINYDICKNNPKIFCGYSDITALSLMLIKKSNLITYSGPMAQTDFNSDNACFDTIKSFFNAVNAKPAIYKSSEIINDGAAEGIMWGGNLSTIVSLCGLDFLPNEKFILFIEDVNEPVYKIDKMLTQLSNIKNFKENIVAIAFGEFSNTDDEKILKYLQKEFVSNMNIPAACGFLFSHSKLKQTVPIGKYATFNDGVIHISN